MLEHQFVGVRLDSRGLQKVSTLEFRVEVDKIWVRVIKEQLKIWLCLELTCSGKLSSHSRSCQALNGLAKGSRRLELLGFEDFLFATGEVGSGMLFELDIDLDMID